MTSNRSSGFKTLMEKHGDPESKDNIFAMISSYEEKIRKRIRLQDIQPELFLKSMNDSIEYIEMSDRILSFVKQLSLTIRVRKELAQKKYDLAEIKARKQIETLNIINEISNKTEKTATIKRMVQEQLLDELNECETLKLHYDLSLAYVEDAERTRDLTYAYYQAVKQVTKL